MSEKSIVQARASVMLYNNERREWEHSGGSQGISRIQVYHHPLNNTYRIVGRKVQDQTVVINCALAKGLKYNEATPTFHQWRDQRQVYGLNFPSKEDAQTFGQAVSAALESLRSSTTAPIPPQQPQHYTQISHMSNGRGHETEEMSNQSYYDHDREQYSRARVSSSAPDNSYRSPYESRESPNSSTTSLPPSAPQPAAQSVPTAPPAPAVPSAPPAPPAPPVPPAAPPIPGGGGGGPPAPPAPPPPPAPSGGGGSLADQIAAAKLKKASKMESESPRVERSNSTSRGGGKAMGGGMNMMEEMARKLAARKAKEGREVEPVKEEAESRAGLASRTSVSAPPPAPALGNNSPKANFLTPAKPANNGPNRKNSKTESPTLSNDQLEELKTELLSEFRQELDTVKREIIEAVRQEMSRFR